MMLHEQLTAKEFDTAAFALKEAHDSGVTWPRGAASLAKLIQRHTGNTVIAERFRQMPAKCVRKWLKVLKKVINIEPYPQTLPPPRREAQPPVPTGMTPTEREAEVVAALHNAGFAGLEPQLWSKTAGPYEDYVLHGSGSPHAVVAAACRAIGD